MAPKGKKERAKPTKKEKSEVESMSEPRHNMAAYLQPEDKVSPEYKGIMEYLHRARINYAITTQHTAYQSQIKEFWNSAVVETVNNQEVIRGFVTEKPVVITENTIRARLQLGDQPEDSTSIDLQCQRGLLMRLGYSENVLANQINKGFMPLRYKFLLHILIHCLSNKWSGYDLSPIELTGLFTALILNKPFNISRYIFDNLKENARRPLSSANQRSSTKFWLYQIPDLPKVEADVLPVNPMNERTLLIFKSMSKYKESDPVRKLIGHLDVPTYEAPQNNKWRRDASDSDDEEPRLIALANTQLEAKHGIKASSKKSAGSSSAATHAEIDVNVVAEEVQGVFVDPDVRGSAGGDGGPASRSGDDTTDKGKGKVDEPRKLVDESSSSSDDEGGSGDDDSSSEDDNPPPPGMRKAYDQRGNFRGFERIEKPVSTAESDKDDDYIPAAPGFVRKKRKARKQGTRTSNKSKDGSGSMGETAGDAPIPVSIQHSTPPEHQLPPVSDQLTTSEMLELVSSPQTSSGTRTVTVDQQPPATPVSGTHTRPPLVITGPTGTSGPSGQSGFSGPEPSRPTLAETLSGLSEAEKIHFLIEQISELGNLVIRHTRKIEEYRVQRTQDVEAHNKLVSIVSAQNLKIKEQALEIERLKEANRARDREVEIMKGHSTVLEHEAKVLKQKHEELSDRYKNRDDRLIEAFKPVHANFKKIDYKVGTLWYERCNALGIVPSKHGDDKDDDATNPDQLAASGSGATASGAAGGSGTSQDAPTAPPTATTGPSEQTKTLEASAGFEHVSLEPEAFTDLPESSIVQQYHPVTGELLEEGEHVTEMSDERVLALKELDEVDLKSIDATPLVPDETDFSTIEEIFIGSDPERPVYVGQDNAEFNALDDEFVAAKTAEFANPSSDSPTAQENREKTVNEWRADFLARNPPPLPPLDQVNYMNLEKNPARGRIISWMFIKELHCMVVKRECGLQYFRSLLSILSLPYYDVAVLAQLRVINRVEDKMVNLFAKKIRLERRRGWKDPLYKPQFPRYEQIRFTLDPDTNTARYRLVYDPPKLMKKIPLLKMRTDFLGNFRCWVYDADTGEAVILFQDSQENFRMIDPMWITNMSRSDIIVLKDHEINYLVRDRE
ncbi:hypothetical protein HanXRQr2_Chr13g0606581 [Helianthus annuus]|uniref:Uncharacterized protein n=1 Tax=Helianthus annuus TaxID=4232 RepID=A0A9K3ELH7_HELAN|nr:hypothetical protein HanXRQr2_Chr13g0606581 [Helianthus annuus]KAJ0850780.1 hypothetical protein HanPSC8_Chr13g0584811 [Helianthus annuus]